MPEITTLFIIKNRRNSKSPLVGDMGGGCRMARGKVNSLIDLAFIKM